MEYKLNKINIGKKNKIQSTFKIKGYKIPSKNNQFVIQKSIVCNIKIINKKLAHPFIYKVVHKKYLKLINKLTDLLTSEDESGVSCREALNQIEKFKAEVKGKYRIYLHQAELKEMANKLKILQKQAKIKEIEIYENQMTFSERRVR